MCGSVRTLGAQCLRESCAEVMGMDEYSRINRAGWKCIWWGIGLIAVAFLLPYLLNVLLTPLFGSPASTDFLSVVSYVVVFVTDLLRAFIPLGAALIAGGIVLRVLAPRHLVDADDLQDLDDDEEFLVDGVPETPGETISADEPKREI